MTLLACIVLRFVGPWLTMRWPTWYWLTDVRSFFSNPPPEFHSHDLPGERDLGDVLQLMTMSFDMQQPRAELLFDDIYLGRVEGWMISASAWKSDTVMIRSERTNKLVFQETASDLIKPQCRILVTPVNTTDDGGKHSPSSKCYSKSHTIFQSTRSTAAASIN